MALSSEGFASGFTKGFGLVTDVQDNFARQKLAEEELRQRDADRKDRGLERKADNDYRTNKDALIAENRQTDLDRAATQRREDQALSATQRSEDLQFKADQLDRTKNAVLDAELTRAETEASNKQTIFERQTGELDRKEADRIAEEKVVLAGQSANDLLSFEVPLEGLNDADAGAFNTAVANTNGGVLALGGALNPYTPEVAENVASEITAFASGQDSSKKESIIGGAGMLIQKNLKGIGETIPSSVEGTPDPYPNAPAGFRTGEWEIISKEAYDVIPNADGSIGVSVLVRVKNNQGQISKYIAPATEGRDPAGLAVRIDAQEFTGGFAGMVHYSSEMSKNKDALYQGMAEAQYRKNGQYDNAAYKQAMSEAEDKFDERLDSRAGQKVMQGSNRTFKDIANNTKLKNEYIRHQLLTNDSIPMSYRDEAMGEIAVARSVGELQTLEKHRRSKLEGNGEAYKPLSDQQILEARTFMDERDGKIFISDGNGYGEWQRKIFGSVIHRPRSRSGTGGVPVTNRSVKP